MAEFNIRSESVDVEQIMKQIRTRIREKRGVDYTEEQIRELASVRLEKFLDPKNLRSDLLEQFRRSRPAIPAEPPPVEPPYTFDDQTLFVSHRGFLRFMRKLLKPVLKLFFNPNTLNQILHSQAQFNVDLMKREQRRKIEFDRSRADWNALYYEVLHNLVLETTRSGIEIKNLKMRLESLASRLDFSERRVRALEGVVQYRPEAVRSRDRDRGPRGGRQPDAERRTDDVAGEEISAAVETPGAEAPPNATTSEATGRRRRRRRRGRRGAGMPGAPGGSPGPATEGGNDDAEGMDAGDDGTEMTEDTDTFEASPDNQMSISADTDEPEVERASAPDAASSSESESRDSDSDERNQGTPESSRGPSTDEHQ
jgi:hypothetical protein